MRHLLVLLLITCSSLFLRAQDTFSISGIIKDAKGEVLPGAAVYLSGYKMATVANNEGKFALNGLKAGNYEVLVQVIGYFPQNKNVIVFDKSVSIEVSMKENVTLLGEVVITADPNRPYYLELFKKDFIGVTPNAAKCSIINPEVIQTDYDKEKKILTVTATDFLIIENKALGYRIKYLLNYFETDQRSGVMFYAGHPHFEELEKTESKQRKYSRLREAAYTGSSQHFFKSLYAHQTKEEGFLIYKVAKVPNKERPADSIINANIKRLTKPYVRGAKVSDAPNDSLKYWKSKKKEPLMHSVLNKSDVLVDTLVKSIFSDVKSISYTDALYILYTKERESSEYGFSGHKISRPPDIPNYQASVVYQLLAPASFYQNGGIFDPRSLLYEGFWAYEKVAEMVPMDYIPLTTK
ncbi:MAG: carboxypeptidase-like regulatory domain-containing protein [Bacteroidota bacterium]